jgi:adenylate cyclase
MIEDVTRTYLGRGPGRRLLNAYYDCVIPAVEQAGGEVVKFMGDGVLAVFEDSEDAIVYGQSCNAVLRAARRALNGIERYNASYPDANSNMRVGTALLYDSVTPGSVGSGERLGFTVIGKDVNLASRIATKYRDLDTPLLMSAPFVDRARSKPSR